MVEMEYTIYWRERHAVCVDRSDERNVNYKEALQGRQIVTKEKQKERETGRQKKGTESKTSAGLDRRQRQGERESKDKEKEEKTKDT